MKKKSILPLVTVTMLATALLGGCTNKTDTTTTTEATPTKAVKEGNSYAGQTISGEVTEIDDDTISMTPEGEEDDISFTVNDDVEITREGMGQSPEMSGDDSSNTPPEMPDGEAPSDNSGQSGDNSSDSNTPPEKPDGEATSGNAPGSDMATSTDASLTDIQIGDMIQVTFDDDGTVTAIVISNGNAGGDAPGQPGSGNSGGAESYDAVSEYTTDTDVDGETFESTGTDENAIHVYDGANAKLNNITVTRSSAESSGGDNSSFYGVGAAILTTDGQTTITNSTITTDAESTTSFSDYEVTQP